MTSDDSTRAGWWGQRPTWQKVLMIAGAAIVVLVVIGAFFGEAPDDEAASSTTTDALSETTTTGEQSTTTTSTADEASTTTIIEEATTTTTQPPTTTTQPPTTTTTLPAVLAKGQGSGDDVVQFDLPEVASIVEFSHDGGSNFAVWSLDSDFEHVDLLVNTIGDFQGTRPLQFSSDESVAGFEITASGPWRFTIEPLQAAALVTCRFAGEGDDVVLVSNFEDSAGIADLSNDGSGNFAVWAWGAADRDLIVNEIGPYTGRVRVPSGLFVWDITAEGGWTVDC